MTVKKQAHVDSEDIELTDDDLQNVAGGKGKKAQGKAARGKKATINLAGGATSWSTSGDADDRPTEE